MQTINTMYSNGYIRAKSHIGWVRVQFDHGLSSEGNHRAAAEKMIQKMEKTSGKKWEISASAPSVSGPRSTDNGWTFIVSVKSEFVPLHMSIVVRFLSSTNTQPSRMSTVSWLNPKARTVRYVTLDCGAEIYGNARYAAELELARINESCREHGDHRGYELDQYVQLPDGDRLFTLKSGK